MFRSSAAAAPPRVALVTGGGILVAAEVRITLADLDDWPLLRSVLATACARLGARGEFVRCLSGTYLPDDGRLLCTFVAPTVESVRRVLDAANLPMVRVGPAISLPDLDPQEDAA
jgi:hypothetical protein